MRIKNLIIKATFFVFVFCLCMINSVQYYGNNQYMPAAAATYPNFYYPASVSDNRCAQNPVQYNKTPSYSNLNAVYETRSVQQNPNKKNPITPRTKLSIFYINDMHGNIDDMSGMIAASDKFDKETAQQDVDTLKISAGDNFSGGNDKKNQVVINLLSRMGIDVSAVGNHEFDSTISAFYKFLNPDKTKFLAANANAPEGSDFYKNVQKSTVIEVNGNKYGLIGLLPFDLETVTGADDKKMEGIRPFDIEESVKIVNEEAQKLTNEGINKIILVSHIGNDKDKEIAPKLHNVDVIVGGHSHTEVKDIKENENLFNNADGDPIIIVQTGENAKNVGILDVEFDESGIPVTAENNLIGISREKSPVLNYIEAAALGDSPVVGQIKSSDPLPANRRTTPCAWTNFMCDAMRYETGSDIAFVNAANIRKAPKAGSLTERNVMESAPLKNTLLVKQMTEKEIVKGIKDALSMSLSHETGEPGILHVSGLSYVSDDSGNLKELNFVDKNGNKTPIDINNPSDKTYRVCYDSFVAKGTEYPVFVPETQTYKEIEQNYDFDKDKLTIDYIGKLPDKDNLVIEDDGRIKIIDKNGNLRTAQTAAPSEESKTAASKSKAEVNNPAPKNAQLTKYSPLLMSRVESIKSNAALKGYGAIKS